MRDVRESYVSTKSTGAKLVRGLQQSPRVVGFSATTLGALSLALHVALNLAPVALGQSQSGSSSPAPTQTVAQAPAQAKTQTPSPSEPQMQDQSAPPEESLAAAARKAKAQKANTAPGKVYTEEKLAGLSGHGVSSVGSGTQGGDASSGSGDSYANSGAAPQSGKSEEQYWRGRAQAIRDQMASLDKQIEGIQQEIKEKGAVTVDPMSGASAGVIYIEDRNRQIKQIEGQKAKLQEQLDALAEEGRKAGADSGWFR
ncbi:MAG TPA: hypothetical protein VN881_14255 [Candidatus Acidoferrales bacterium]|nr:hypothetical protein [Candidatus Acidoferrales bacterium]